MLSVVVPIHNEEELLEGFLSELVSSLEKFKADHEIIAVENGSKVITLSEANYGLALKFGILRSSHEYIVIYNVDYWDRCLVNLCQDDLSGSDIIVGSKRLAGSKDDRPLLRRAASNLLNKFIHLAFAYRGTDTHRVKILRRKTVLPFVQKCYPHSNLFDTELMVRAQRANLKIKEVPAQVQEIRPSRFRHRYLKILPELVHLYSRLLRI